MTYLILLATSHDSADPGSFYLSLLPVCFQTQAYRQGVVRFKCSTEEASAFSNTKGGGNFQRRRNIDQDNHPPPRRARDVPSSGAAAAKSGDDQIMA